MVYMVIAFLIIFYKVLRHVFSFEGIQFPQSYIQLSSLKTFFKLRSCELIEIAWVSPTLETCKRHEPLNSSVFIFHQSFPSRNNVSHFNILGHVTVIYI